MKYSRRRVSLPGILVALLALFSSGAEGADTAGAGKARQDAALALIDFPWQQLNYEIVFLPPQRGIRAMILFSKKRIEIYARPGEDSRTVAYDIAHELGHAIDRTLNNTESRKRWMESRGIDPATEWFGCNRCSDYNTPAGDFAETFAYLLLGPNHFRGRVAPPPTAEQIEALMPFFQIDPVQSPR